MFVDSVYVLICGYSYLEFSFFCFYVELRAGLDCYSKLSCFGGGGSPWTMLYLSH